MPLPALTPQELADIIRFADQLPEPGKERASNLNPQGESLYTSTDNFLRDLRAEAGRVIERGLTGPSNLPANQIPGTRTGTGVVAGLVNPVPGSVPEAAMTLANPVMAVSGVGPLKRALMMGAANATAGGIQSGPAGAVLGGTAGAVGGLVGSRVRALGAPNQATQAVLGLGKAIEKRGSPELAQAIGAWEKDPNLLMSETAIMRMHRGASQAIQGVVDEVTRLAPNALITIPGIDPAMAVAKKLSVTQIPGQGGQMLSVGSGNFAELDSARRAFVAEKAWGEARAVENAMVRFAESLPPGKLGKQYLDSLTQYRTDMRLIDATEAFQSMRALPGGVNRTDYPELVGPSQMAAGKGGRDLSRAGLYSAKAAALGPTNAFGLNALASAVKATMGRGGMPITQPISNPSGLVRNLTAGGDVALSSMAPLGALRLLQPGPTPPEEP